MRTNRRFRMASAEATDWLAALINTWWNRLQYWKARKLADQMCLANRCRVFVIPIQGHYVVTPSTEVKAANRQLSKGQRKNIYDLLLESQYTVTFDQATQHLKATKQIKIPFIYKRKTQKND